MGGQTNGQPHYEPATIGDEAGLMLLHLLSQHGWTVTLTTAFAGGVLLIAQRSLEVTVEGDDVAAAAARLVDKITRLSWVS